MFFFALQLILVMCTNRNLGLFFMGLLPNYIQKRYDAWMTFIVIKVSLPTITITHTLHFHIYL